MKKLLLLVTFLSLSFISSAQKFGVEGKEDERTGKMSHEMTEYYYGVQVVTPGDAKTNSAPSDAIILFDGKDLTSWVSDDGSNAEWIVNDNGTLTVNPKAKSIKTKENFGDCQLHIEWCVPEGMQGEGQGRGNSGIFLQGLYEVQVLDSYNNETYSNGQAGSIYKQSAPLVNAMRPQGQWNSYDIIYTAPTFKSDGMYRTYPQITVLLNGVLIQNNTIILGTTEYIGLPIMKKHGDGPIMLQNHGNAISFRNIWIRKL